ncbi:UNVERIFIED_CONTAM: hypothetical protein GTU68_063410 [Idotea baltica]|nr:hypothetical protein [Idotea baltica]
MFLRGWKHYLFDQWGRPHLDVYNNVPHVGHAHPRLQSVVSEQLKRLNTNTRYLNPAQSAFAKALKKKLPSELSVCYFVNSGSEANELALRLSRAHTKAKHMITPDHGYHGNTTGAVDISAYKFNAPGGVGQSDWVHLVDIPDSYADPIGVVVTTQAIADSFAKGPEFFSTFGGSTLSCMVGKTVLDIVEDEALQSNAAQRGRQAINGLVELQKKHACIGDVRGIGLFIGVALVLDRNTKAPASDVASYVVNRLREHRILAGLEGPDNNILKIRPPLSIASLDVEHFLETLDIILCETAICA